MNDMHETFSFFLTVDLNSKLTQGYERNGSTRSVLFLKRRGFNVFLIDLLGFSGEEKVGKKTHDQTDHVINR